jgi:hypothetical protein
VAFFVLVDGEKNQVAFGRPTVQDLARGRP